MYKSLVTAIALGTIGAITVPMAVSSASASPALFESLSGKWRGKGLVKGSPKGKKESIRCRMTNTAKDGTLDLKGSCAVSGFVFSLNGSLDQTGSNAYKANMFRAVGNLKQSKFAGKRSGKRINFQFLGFDRLSKTDIKATIVVNAKSANTFTISVNRNDPESNKNFDVGTITFAKR